MKVILGLDRYSIGVPSCPSESYRHSTRFQIRRMPFYVQRPLFQLKIKPDGGRDRISGWMDRIRPPSGGFVLWGCTQLPLILPSPLEYLKVQSGGGRKWKPHPGCLAVLGTDRKWTEYPARQLHNEGPHALQHGTDSQGSEGRHRGFRIRDRPVLFLIP